MPTYEYVCTDCGKPLEVVQSFTDDALTECPNCAGKLRKVFGNVGVSFKGSGFYKTDSRGNTSKPAAASTETKSTETKSTESTPAASTSKESASKSSESSSTSTASDSSSSSSSSTKAS